MEPREATEFLRQFSQARGPESLTDRPPIAFAVRMVPGYSPDDPVALYEPSVLLYPVLDPVIDARITQAGAFRRGSMTWQIGLGEAFRAAAISASFAVPYAGTVAPAALLRTARGSRELSTLANTYAHSWQVHGYPPLIRQHVTDAAHRHAGRYAQSPYNGPVSRHSMGVITFSVTNGSLWFKAHTNGFTLPPALVEEIGAVDLNLRPIARGPRRPPLLRPAQLVAICEWLAALGVELVDADGSNALARVRYQLAHHVVAWSRPGQPAQAQVSIGTRVAVPALPSHHPVPAGRTSPFEARYVEQTEFARASRLAFLDSADLSFWESRQVPMIMHPATADMASLAAAVPMGDVRLRHRQREAVGLHLATQVGYANFSDPGAGKTVMTLDALRLRAAQVAADVSRAGRGYRALIIAEANVRDQFAGEAATWFPGAYTAMITSSAQAPALRETLDEAGGLPVVVITSYALASQAAAQDAPADVANLFDEEDLDIIDEIAVAVADAAPEEEPEEVVVAAPVPSRAVEYLSNTEAPTDLLGLLDVIESESHPDPDPVVNVTLGAVLASVSWDDIVADEAAGLRNPNSKQSRALWDLRRRSRCALALTGTPYSRSADDLGAIVSWVRNDRYMFSGINLEEKYDLSTDEGVAGFHAAFGPIIFRMTESEFAEDLPTEQHPLIIQLSPTMAESRLADEARFNLARHYTELVALIESLEDTSPDDPDVVKLREDLRHVRGAVLGGGQLARMAASDPAALVGNSSAGAMLLESVGLISDANRQPGTKRLAAVKLCVERVAAGERIVLFTEFATVARGLIEDLRAAGLRVGEILGGGGKKRDEHRRAFQAGELDIVVATSAGERGMNLQSATTLIHYDLAWSPTSIIQRTGRIKRIGSTAKSIQVVFLVMKGTIEERVLAVVVARAIAMMKTMNSTTGLATDATGFGRTFSSLIGVADERELRGRHADLLHVTQELLASGPAPDLSLVGEVVTAV